MQQDFEKFQIQLKKHEIKMTESLITDTIDKFSLFYNEIEFSNSKNKFDSEFIIIDENINRNYPNEKILILCFDFTILVINQQKLYLLKSYFSKQQIIYCLKNNIKDELLSICNSNDLNFSSEDQALFIDYEIPNFNSRLKIKDKTLAKFWDLIKSSISGFLIKQSYKNSYFERICVNPRKFESNSDEIKFSDKEFINLRFLVADNASLELIYHIQKCKLFVIKYQKDTEFDKLIERERNNYLNINYLFILTYYGYGESYNQKYIVFEYINGSTLGEIEKLKLSITDKFSIIFELINTFQFIHNKGYIYRDLKPNNVMIDKSNTAVLIDFDRMIKKPINYDEITLDFYHSFYAPEIVLGSFTNSCDIYSLGLMIYYIMTEKEPNYDENTSPEMLLADFPSKFPELKEICKKCIQKNPKSRITSKSLFDIFFKYCLFSNETNIACKEKILDIYDTIFLYCNNTIKWNDLIFRLGIVHKYDDIPDYLRRTLKYYKCAADLNNSEAQIRLGSYFSAQKDTIKAIQYYTMAANQNNADAQYELARIYHRFNQINKSFQYYTMAANQNNPKAQFELGLFYLNGNHVSQNIEKGIYLLNLSANQKNVDAMLELGSVYLKQKDYSKSFYFFKLASEQNDKMAQYNMGVFYLTKMTSSKDIKKAIDYFYLSANQNYDLALFMLGKLYYEGKVIKRDINKSIKYFQLASKQNYDEAFYYLGYIYYEGVYVQRNINYAIHNFLIAAEKNYDPAQYKLGEIFYKGVYVQQDINKSLYYLNLSADNNNDNAHFLLGYIYYEGTYFKRNVQKALNYLQISAKQRNVNAYYYLGKVYYDGIHIPRDIDKSIYYFSLASDQNNSDSQYNLGYIYYKIKKKYDLAIHYFELSANNNNSKAQFMLGLIYFEGNYLPKNINKALKYWNLSSTLKNNDAQFHLGLLYYDGIDVPRDINKSIFYFTLAANQNDSRALHNLGWIYYNEDKYSNINNVIKYFTLAADLNYFGSQFCLGAFYYEGSYIKRDIKKAISYFKAASNLNDPLSKNNLGIIYKNGDGVPKNIYLSIEYFNEAINHGKLSESMYNLAHIYFFEEEGIMFDIEKAINLLIRSLIYDKIYSLDLLCLALILKYKKLSVLDIQNELKKNGIIKKVEEISLKIMHRMQILNLFNENEFQRCYEIHRNTELVFHIDMKYNKSKVAKKTKSASPMCENITKDFYDGFGVY